MADISVLEVLLHGVAIATITELGNDRNVFVFNQAYIENPDRPTLSLSFKDSYGALITDIKPTQTKIAPFFANLLPEGPMRDYLAKKANVNVERDFFLLQVLGQDLPGAVTVKPVNEKIWPTDSPQNQIENYIKQNTVLRFSLAGVQLKFSAVMETTGGLTIPVNGMGGSWILKLPSTKFNNVPENEFSMLTLAKQIGITVPEVALQKLEDISGLPDEMATLGEFALAIKRFDRTSEGEKIHTEDFAQVFGVYPNKKYERASYKNIAEVLWAETGEDAIAEFIRRIVFNTLIGNADMHLKNWSLIYPDGRNAVLSPAYDYVSTISYIRDYKMALNYSRTKNMTELTTDELSHLAAKAKLPEKLVIDTALETVEKFNSVWKKEKYHLTISNEVVKIIDKHIKTIPL